MERDDLHAALGDLAAHVEDADGDALSVVRDRGRRRRRRRRGAITSAAAALLVAIAFVGVAIASRDPSPPAISTGQPPTPVSTTAPGDGCTLADLESVTTLPMPTPIVVTQTRSYPDNQARLDPPPAGVEPKAPASVAWAGMRGGYRMADYEIALGSYSALIPSTAGVPTFRNRLMWVVTGTHVPFMPSGGAFVPRTAGETTVPQPVCFFATQVTLFDANTGQELEQSTTGW